MGDSGIESLELHQSELEMEDFTVDAAKTLHQGDVETCPQIPDLKIEIKTEEEIWLGETGGFLCPRCRKHFFYDGYLAERK